MVVTDSTFRAVSKGPGFRDETSAIPSLAVPTVKLFLGNTVV